VALADIMLLSHRYH